MVHHRRTITDIALSDLGGRSYDPLRDDSGCAPGPDQLPALPP
jgi:hypothetical protein